MFVYGRTDLDQIGNVHRHLSDFGCVELFDITEVTDITFSEEVDGHTLTTETPGTTDTMDVILSTALARDKKLRI